MFFLMMPLAYIPERAELLGFRLNGLVVHSVTKYSLKHKLQQILSLTLIEFSRVF